MASKITNNTNAQSSGGIRLSHFESWLRHCMDGPVPTVGKNGVEPFPRFTRQKERNKLFVETVNSLKEPGPIR
jgi:hypothetical protein